ncbi:MAG: hypothetical protein A2504_14940 [Bdellovibrionales bacterium RIFOXYD12_FULL_39_22]|nr:MAG: hypothetical protein A2385_10405 [Bdellovibrionales bacterium RIFOXYB1_FULL_39_21]OFZ40881.1 MAG: hypothetical protein A2485_17565 [Bdellovibrionales bacterium RIFOXYC12_FULL_39_17]OFZ44422.1 MAG: hypothetical protein A2404_11175 [Bdellovibrionales bacterium RIFOXYC1_FULL_39_130]OFZ71883.1 MAG: hypothetical protein A2451_14070 [Bdellovibrionales bacterium RIFOXYC2_FULL_39_8]OFZ74169.1 MAG: hypothetical protein A2560_03840 [Bdellovibrionales bacterium RIFOXYD1_FULL_39_84]OFZ92018.1 MAG:
MISPKRFSELISAFSSIRPVLVVGDVGVDKYTIGSVRRVSPEAPVPVLEVNEEFTKLGLASNVSNNLKSLGIESTLCGVVGQDSKADIFTELLRKAGISAEGVIQATNRMTTFKERVTTAGQQICRVDYETIEPLDKSLEDSFTQRVINLKSSHAGLIIEDYGKGVLTQKVLADIIDRFTSEGMVVTIDPSRTTPPQYYKGATLLKPNLLEATKMVQALGHSEKALERISEILVEKLKLSKLVITLGGEGMALLDTKASGKLEYIPTVASEVFDVSGAGDTAISLITAGLLAGGSLAEACWLGNCGSGVVVGKRGTATVNTQELSEYYHRITQKLK